MKLKLMIASVALVVIVLLSAFTQIKNETWILFGKTKFQAKYYEKLGEYVNVPVFTDDVKNLVGKEVMLQGYYVPFAPDDGKYLILSRYPMSQCYFCGGGGPETIAEVHFNKMPGKFKVDDLITLKGKLKLNVDDPDHLNFLLIDAVILSK